MKTAGVVLCKEGEIADVFYLIMSGKCEVLYGGKQIASLGQWQVFGESVLFPNENGTAVRKASVVVAAAAADVHLLYLTRAKFDRLVDMGTLNTVCLSKLAVVAERRAKENELLQVQDSCTI